MLKLNHEAYKQLRNADIDACEYLINVDQRNWYELTYQLFKDAPLESINDFWKIVAYTYSWMPTIPDVKAHLIKDPAALLQNLRELKEGDSSNLSSLFVELIPVINNSLIGVSKVLHFISPDIIPIIDRNVLRGWDIFFFQLHPEFTVPKLPNYKSALNRTHIAKYLSYKEILEQWVANCEGLISIRDLEFGFFELGRNYRVEEIQMPIFKM